MAATATMRRGGVVAVAVLLVAMGLSGPALAAPADTSHFRGDQAVARWAQGDARNTRVLVGATDGTIVDPPQLPRDVEDVYVAVSQRYCDADADETVHRSYFGFAQKSASIDGVLLSEASADMDATMTGYEWRSPDCDEPGLPGGPATDLGEHDVELSASWEATGRMDVTADGFRFDGDSFMFHARSVRRLREAQASATLTGLADAGVDRDLGSSDDAEILSGVDNRVTVQHP